MTRVFLAALCLLTVANAAEARTDWRVHSSEGLDAVLLVGVLSGDKLQSKQYPEEAPRYQSSLTEKERSALERIGAFFAEPGHGLAGPSFAYYLAAVDDQSLDGMLAALKDPAALAVKVAGDSPGDSLDGAKDFETLAPDYRTALLALKRVGFDQRWRKEFEPALQARVGAIKMFLAPYDIIPVQEKYLGRDLDDAIEVIVLHYNKPYGIRVAGQRFVTNEQWGEKITLRTAAHEIFHPPFELKNKKVWDAAAGLENSPLIENILQKADPAFGYTDFEGLLNEDSTEALDKLVGETLGFAPDPGEFWRAQDGGMHLLAAAIYDAMKETGFAKSGGRYQDWLVRTLTDGTLSPQAVRRRAAKIVGEDAVAKWDPAAP